MPSYAITGASRGIGWALLQHVSSDPNNKVIALVRSPAPTEKRVKEELAGRSNIYVLQADITDHASMKRAAGETSKITDGSLDYLIGNAAFISQFDAYDGIGSFEDQLDEFNKEFRAQMDANVLGQIHLINLFMPLVLKGSVKKVTVISSGMGDIEFVKDFNVHVAPIYAMTKAAVNMVIAKFSAQYKKDGVLFLAICPGMVETGIYKPEEMSEHHIKSLESTLVKFKSYAPTFKGPDSAEDSANSVLSVIWNSSVEKQGGAYLSHFGDKTWIK